MFLLKKKNSTKDKEGHYIMIEGLVYQEDIMILPVYTSNNSLKIRETKTDRAERRNRQIPIIDGDFSSPPQQSMELVDKKSAKI